MSPPVPETPPPPDAIDRWLADVGQNDHYGVCVPASLSPDDPPCPECTVLFAALRVLVRTAQREAAERGIRMAVKFLEDADGEYLYEADDIVAALKAELEHPA